MTDEVLPQYDFAESFLKKSLPAAHLIRPCGAPSPPGEGFSGGAAKLKQLDKPGFEAALGKKGAVCVCLNILRQRLLHKEKVDNMVVIHVSTFILQLQAGRWFPKAFAMPGENILL